MYDGNTIMYDGNYNGTNEVENELGDNELDDRALIVLGSMIYIASCNFFLALLSVVPNNFVQ